MTRRFLLLASATVLLTLPASSQPRRPAAQPKSSVATATPVPSPVVATVPPAKPVVPRGRRYKPISANERRVRAANGAATLQPTAYGFINAVQVYPYADGAIYQVYTAPERVTDIALQPGEALGAVASGDTVRWVIGDTTSGSGTDRRTHILVKPFAPGLSTNLVITTDRRSYHVTLTSTTATAMAALSWTYPADQLIALRRASEATEAAKPVASGLTVEALRFNYDVSGDTPMWRPVRAFDDGRQTFIEFPPSLSVGEAPPLFLVDAKGEVSLVNYRVAGRFYVVDRIFDRAELRLGTKHQDVVRITRIDEGGRQGRGA
ncbi:P-type conjugative transfer protein TrbG [Sphingomonas sp. OK281]|uniref:P-type conjugative transfer protein TrbG n=1 Tax=Sphingomonas sp. OK281 TaxID=1881067 RepID=UPI0008E779CF|nr:P-type conjugative transfer protein TrbG [Sphingomonas sp. OK281]SFN66802.1 type IV secretion system protein VirB9 [Sphingomonas sp. OK281]